MTHNNPLTLIGSPPSPYTMKMLALLRYRRIPHAVIWGNPADVLAQRGIAPPKVALLPTFVFEGDEGAPSAMVDSTPIIRKLEGDFNGRAVLPVDPALAFVDYLLEDFADEWGTKYMFHYRWRDASDIDNAGTLLPLCLDPSMPTDKHQAAKQYFKKRQIERLYVVGSNDVTTPVIDASYRRFLEAMETHLAAQPYLLGKRPSASDFAFYGQLSQLCGFDPTPRRITHELAPRTVAWTQLAADLSGLEPNDDDWMDLAGASTLRGILNEVGRVYAPALLANARALEAGDKEWEAEIDGTRWAQQSFPYQGKCLQWINEQYQALEAANKARVNEALAGTGCEALLLT